jgi:hypothetical protein
VILKLARSREGEHVAWISLGKAIEQRHGAPAFLFRERRPTLPIGFDCPALEAGYSAIFLIHQVSIVLAGFNGIFEVTLRPATSVGFSELSGAKRTVCKRPHGCRQKATGSGGGLTEAKWGLRFEAILTPMLRP